MITTITTKKFGVYAYSKDYNSNGKEIQKVSVYVDINCRYTKRVVVDALKSRHSFVEIVPSLPQIDYPGEVTYQICDFENIVWERVLTGAHYASSYVIRKGLSRKAQMSLQIKRFISKHPQSILSTSVPFTLILDIWNAFDDNITLNFGGTIAHFDMSSMMMNLSLRQRLEWCLEDIKEDIASKEILGWLWIMKPSVINKGQDIKLVRGWDSVIDNLEEHSEIREWVIQRFLILILIFEMISYTSCPDI